MQSDDFLVISPPISPLHGPNGVNGVTNEYNRCIRKGINDVDVELDGTLLIMKNTHFFVWKPGYGYVAKRRISRRFPGISGFMNALVSSPKTGDTYIFKGSQMWVFDRKQKLYDNFPIWSGHLGLPYGPDAAFVYNGHIVVLKQDKYWILQEEPIQIPEGYPQPVNSTCESFKNLKNRCILWMFRNLSSFVFHGQK